MIEILKSGNFTISTVNGVRPIKFSDPFDDSEFDSYSINGEKFRLTSGGYYIEYKWQRNVFMGQDWRGGYSQIVPEDPDSVANYIKSSRQKHTLNTVPPKPPIEKKHSIALISNYHYDGCDLYKPDRIYDQFNKLFEMGYNIVGYFENDLNKFCLDLMSRLVYNKDAAVVQATHSHNFTNSDYSNYHEELGDLKNYIISGRIWYLIKNHSKKGNIETCINLAVQDKSIKRYALSQSRDKNWNIGDRNRQTFNFKTIEELK